MTDEFIERLKGDWQSIDTVESTVEFGELRKQLSRRRVISKLWMTLELFTTLGCIGAGVYFVINVGGWLGWGSALMLGGFVSALFIWSWQVRRSAMHWEDRGPEGVLEFGCRDLRSRIKLVRILRIHCLSLLGFVLVLWVLQWIGLVDDSGFLILYSLLSVAVVTPLWLVAKHRTRHLNSELDRYMKLLEDLQRS
jgi:hypothetical protein